MSTLESFTYYGDWNCGKKFDIFAWKELSVKRHVQMRIYKEFINVFLSKNLVKESRFPEKGKSTWNRAASKGVFWGVKMLKKRSIYSAILKLKPTNK